MWPKKEMDIDALEDAKEIENTENTKKQVQKISQEQIHDLLFGEQLSWQAIIYDLVNTEQLNPWDIDISLLSGRFLDKVRKLEEANFFVSSKILLAATLLLRMKSEILLDYDIRDLDAILFGRKEEKTYKQERIDLDEDIPELIVRTPLPRFRKVTLEQLIRALDVAIKTETRRIQRVTITKQQEYEMSASLPKQRINIQDRISGVYSRIAEVFKMKEEKLAFSEIAGGDKEERVSNFVPLLYLETQQKIWLEQKERFSEIWILLQELYEKNNFNELEALKKEVEEELEKLKLEEKKEEEAYRDDSEFEDGRDLFETKRKTLDKRQALEDE